MEAAGGRVNDFLVGDACLWSGNRVVAGPPALCAALDGVCGPEVLHRLLPVTEFADVAVIGGADVGVVTVGVGVVRRHHHGGDVLDEQRRSVITRASRSASAGVHPTSHALAARAAG